MHNCLKIDNHKMSDLEKLLIFVGWKADFGLTTFMSCYDRKSSDEFRVPPKISLGKNVKNLREKFFGHKLYHKLHQNHYPCGGRYVFIARTRAKK